MPSVRLSVELEPEIARALEDLSIERGSTVSDVIRAAVQRYLESYDESAGSAFEVARRLGILGMVEDLPPDLSSDARHMDGFGEC